MKALLSFIAITALSSALIAGNGKSGYTFQQYGSSQQIEQHLNCDVNITNTLPVYDLSYAQQSTIEFMYQEEKMARDVYLTFYEKYALSIFKNIANAEQKHMDSVKVLLDKYSLSVAIDEEVRGEFMDATLQELYAQLVEQGSVSLEDALKAGQTIESVDIEDLVVAIAEANEDAKLVYEHLKLGSENHLAAFTRVLDGSTQYDSQNTRGKGQKSNRR